MTVEKLKDLISEKASPRGLAKPLQALWEDANGNWDRAHEIAQSISDWKGAWVHAYLHRKEGDIGNATYWYSRAGKPLSKAPLDEEWEEIAEALLREQRS